MSEIPQTAIPSSETKPTADPTESSDLQLTQFGEWLGKTGRSPSTVHVYQTNVRGALHVMAGPFDAEALRSHTANLAPSTRRVFLSAWRSFQAYMAAAGSEPIPEPNGAHADIPEDVAYAVWLLARHGQIPIRTLGLLRWDHVDLEKNRIEAIHSKKPGQFFAIDGKLRQAVLTIRDWGVPPDVDPVEACLPLVPYQAGAIEPRGAQLLKADLASVSRVALGRGVSRPAARPPLPPSAAGDQLVPPSGPVRTANASTASPLAELEDEDVPLPGNSRTFDR